MEIVDILDAARLHQGWQGCRDRTGPLTVALLFLAPSLRTRIGFSAAAARLGGVPVEIFEPRWAPGMSAAESFRDTLRSVSGMADVTVLRVPFSLHREEVAASTIGPVINGGDASGEHPTQALIDLFAIENMRGPIGEQRIGICGDLRSRTVHSLLKLLGRFHPRSLTLMAPACRSDLPMALEPSLSARTTCRADMSVQELDVLYLAGLPEGRGTRRLAASTRGEFALTAERMEELPKDALVLSPMPVIDEISTAARDDGRLAMFRQSDAGVPVRMALLEFMTERRRSAQ